MAGHALHEAVHAHTRPSVWLIRSFHTTITAADPSRMYREMPRSLSVTTDNKIGPPLLVAFSLIIRPTPHCVKHWDLCEHITKRESWRLNPRQMSRLAEFVNVMTIAIS